MKRQDLTYKHLNESSWKNLSAKYQVTDIGLSKALADCAKHSDKDEYDGVLKSLSQATDYAKKLRTSKDVAPKREVCAYLDNVSKELEKARQSVAEEKKDAAEEEKSDADEQKLVKAIGVELAAGLTKAKGRECQVLICPATPTCGVMVATTLTSQHKTNLSKYTGSTKFLPVGTCTWDAEKSQYVFVLQMRDASLGQRLQNAIYYFSKLKVKAYVMTRADYDEVQREEVPEEEPVEDGVSADSSSDASASASDDNDADVGPGEASEESAPEAEPLLTGVRPFDISGSVGQGGKNNPDDVKQVQIALNKKGASLAVDGKIGSKTIQAIKVFQKKIGIPYPDGLVEVGKKTATALGSSGSGSSGGYGGKSTGDYGGASGGYGGKTGNGGQYSGTGGGKNYSGGNTGGYANSGGGGYGGSGGGGYGGKTGGNSGYAKQGGGSGGYGGNSGGGYGGNSGGYGDGQSGYTGGNAGGYRGQGTTGGGGASDNPGTSETVEDGVGDRIRDAADNVYEQRKAQAEQKINEGIDSVEEALLPDNNVVGEGPISEG